MTIQKVTAINSVADFIAAAVLRELALSKKVLWFVTGGSSIPVAVMAASLISRQPHTNLTVTLTDERYGPVNHPDSNWRELLALGFNLPQATCIPVLTGDDRAMTVKNFNDILGTELAQADYKIGMFGIGADGHTAGILPESEALRSEDWAYGYTTEKFERITITPKTILQLDEAIVYVKGEEKQKVIEELHGEKSITKQPAQILKKVPVLTIFTQIQI